MPTVLLFGDYAVMLAELGKAAADATVDGIRLELTQLTTNMESLVAKVDDLIVAAQNVSDQATEHRAVVDDAIELIKSMGIDDPRLDAVIAQLATTAEQLDTATTDLAAADDAPEEPPAEEPPPEEPPPAP